MNFKKGNRQSAAKIFMKIDFNKEQINEIKYLYENTLSTIEQIAKKFNTSWNKISNIIHQYNIIKSDELKHQILVNRNNKRWSNMTPEQRSNNAKKGHLKKQGKYKEEIYAKVGSKVSKAYHNKSKEEKDRLAKEHSEKVKIYWDNLSEEKKEQFRETQKSLWTPKRKAEHGQKISNRYHAQPESEKIRRRNVTSIKSEEMWHNMNITIKIKRSNKLSNSIKIVWKNRDEITKSQIYTNIFNTMIKNKSFSKSAMEEMLDKIFKDIFTDYVWQFKINNYYFDFKINYNSEETYIELNGKYWHYDRPFDNSENDLMIYNSLISDNISQHKNIAKKWRYTDTKKLNYCKENNKNLIVIYYDDIKQLDEIYNFILENLNSGIKILVL